MTKQTKKNCKSSNIKILYRKLGKQTKNFPGDIIYPARGISLVAELVLPKHRAPVRFRYSAQKTMLFVDAGFHDPGYLKDILGWLFQDAEDTKKDENNPTRIQLRKNMADAMRKIRRLLGSNQ